MGRHLKCLDDHSHSSFIQFSEICPNIDQKLCLSLQAQAVTLSVAQAFNLAYEKYEDSKLKLWKDTQNKEQKSSFSLVSCHTGISPSHHALSPPRPEGSPQQNGQHNGQMPDWLTTSGGSTSQSHQGESKMSIILPHTILFGDQGVNQAITY